MEKLYIVSKSKILSWLLLRSLASHSKIQVQTNESGENHYASQVWPKSNPLWICSGGNKLVQGMRYSKQCAWRTMGRGPKYCTGGSEQNHPKEKEKQEGKMVIWEGFTNSQRKRSGKQGRKEKVHLTKCRIAKNSLEIRRPSSMNNTQN